MSRAFQILFLSIVFLPIGVYGTSITMFEFDEREISLEQAKAIGLIPVLLEAKDRRGHVTFRVERPESISGECKVRFATVELFEGSKSITSFIMTEYGTEGKEYFSANVNPAVVSSFLLEVFCGSNRIYKFKVGANAL